MSLILDTTCFKIFVVENDLPMTEQIRIDNMDNKGFKPTYVVKPIFFFLKGRMIYWYFISYD